MAQVGYTPISLYYSTTGSAVPANTNLVNGELAINITDGKLYYKDNAGVVKLLASNGASTPVTTISFGSTGLTPNTATSGAVSVAGTLGAGYGGTGQNTYAVGDLLIASGATTLSKLAIGANTYVLTSNGTTASWAAVPSSMVYPGAGIPNSTGSAWGTSYSTTGSGTVVALATSPSFTTPSLGVATATSVNGLTITSTTGTLTMTNAKTLSVTNTLTLSGTDSTTMTFPATNQTLAGLAVSSQVFTTAQTFRAASAVRSEAAATQDAIVIAGRAGGTSSYAVTVTPTTLSANRTLTAPDADTTVPIASQVLTFSGPTAARTYTLPDTSTTLVGTTDSQTLTNKTFTDPAIIGTILEDVYTIVDGAAFEVDPGNGSIQLITLGASRTPKATNFAAGEAITLMVDDGSAYTITWTDATWGGSGVVWMTGGGTAPTLNTTGYTTIVLWKVSTQVYGAKVG